MVCEATKAGQGYETRGRPVLACSLEGASCEDALVCGDLGVGGCSVLKIADVCMSDANGGDRAYTRGVKAVRTCASLAEGV